MIGAIKIYINYATIEQSIEQSIYNNIMGIEQNAFTQNFLLPYLDSEYAEIFFRRENNQLPADEFIIILQEAQPERTTTDTFATGMIPELTSGFTQNTSPPQAWREFLQDRWAHIR